MSEIVDKQAIKQYILKLSWDDIVSELYEKNQQIKKLRKMVSDAQEHIKKLQSEIRGMK